LHPHIVFPLLGVLLAVLGWPMARRRVRPNRWYGLRVPATFADERVWYDANAAAGRDMIVLGALLGAVALGLHQVPGIGEGVYVAACAGVLSLGSLALVVRGWRIANQLLRERRSAEGAA
jgi:uncharacterized membrane protein